MATKKQIGIFWGQEFLSIAETQGDRLLFAGAIPRQIAEGLESAAEAPGTVAPENIHLTAAIQRLIRERQISKPKIHIAIPARDVIFRSFTLPVMNPNEIENAVIFEAPRYIPFKLTELFYTYHAVPFTEKDVKKNQILFLAIRKDTLDQYCKVVEDAQLEVRSAEPSLLALQRILIIKKFVKPNQTIAVIQINDTEGSLMIADQHFPQFIRDFNLASTNSNSSEPNFKSLVGRILNEARVSLEFYARQTKTIHREKQIEQIYVFSNQDTNEICRELKNDLGIETISFDINEIFPYENQLHSNVADAIGASFGDLIIGGFSLNLAKARQTSLKGITGSGLEGFLARPPDYKLTAIIAAICLLLVGGSFTETQLRTFPQQKRLADLKIFDEKYKTTSVSMINKLSDTIKKKVEIYKNLRFKSDMGIYLENVSQSLLDGVWLTNLDIVYNETEATSVRFNLTGYSYSEQLDKQITLVENFLENLRTNPFFKKHSKKIDLGKIKKERYEEFPVTLFQINMEIEGSDG